MASPSSLERTAAGITVKSGWACAVLIDTPGRLPRVLDSRRIDLSDPASPAAKQPYHDGFGTARPSGPALSRLVASVEQFGAGSMQTVLDEWSAAGRVAGVGVVVGSMIDPDRIGNSHVRIHALEGRLFRTVVADAVTRAGLPVLVHRERDLLAIAIERLNRSDSSLRAALTAAGRDAGTTPWRAEQKAAALAAWLMLASAGDRDLG